MRLFIISLGLFALAACRPVEPATKSNTTLLNRNANAYQLGQQSQRPCLNLNTATVDELVRLQGIGEVMAKKIIDYRERHGRFRRPEEIIIIEGFSERKYKAISDLICVDR
ncbi:MAG: helix-hairpin-helix domain-containing protein [Blastocatellia bacterium]